MEETIVRDVLQRYVTADEPPLRTTSATMVRAGRRSRRLRTLGGAGGALLAVATVLTGLSWAWPQADRADPARPGEALAVPGECAGGLPQEAADELRVTCQLTEQVAALLPGAAFSHVFDGESAATVPPLHAYPRRAGSGLGADAVVHDADGTGMLLFIVMPRSAADPPPTKARCSSRVCQLREGPHGETLAVYRKADQEGSTDLSVHVYTGETVVIATSTNHPPDNTKASRPAPPLTVDDLIHLATVPELTIYS
jgi:hypothetical protein